MIRIAVNYKKIVMPCFIAGVFLAWMTISFQAIAASLEARPKTVAQAQFYNVLSRITRCSPLLLSTCRMDVYTPQDFLYYLKNCTLLNNWFISYSPLNHESIGLKITAFGKHTCLITVTDVSQKKQQTCQLTTENVKQIINDTEAADFIEDFDNTAGYGKQFSSQVLLDFNNCLTTNPHGMPMPEEV